MSLLCGHVGEVLPAAAEVAALGPRYFVAASQLIQAELTGVLLPELLSSMVLMQTCLPRVVDATQAVPPLAGLLQMLDRFNRLAPGAQREDEEDLAWPGGIGG